MVLGEVGWTLWGGVVMSAREDGRVEGRDQEPLGGVLGTEWVVDVVEMKLLAEAFLEEVLLILRRRTDSCGSVKDVLRERLYGGRKSPEGGAGDEEG
jgi:hypothetical protein